MVANIRKMKQANFDPHRDLTPKALRVFETSSFVFYEDRDGVYYVCDNSGESHGTKLGTINDVIDHLEAFADDDTAE